MTDGGYGWVWAGSRSLECFKEYDWTEFCSVVVKKRFFNSLPYFNSLTWPWVDLVAYVWILGNKTHI